MRVLHLSDLHLTRYGEAGGWAPRDALDDRWELLASWHRWQVEGLRDRKNRPDKLRLVDPEGVVHWGKGWPAKDDKLIAAMLELAMSRHKLSSEYLIHHRPNKKDLQALLRVNRKNTNLLLLDLLDEVERLEPELVLITGDLTDNGLGYEMIAHYFDPWIKEQKLFVIPGNHDTYEMIPRFGRRARIAIKEDGYRSFAKHASCEPNEVGAYIRYFNDIAIVGLSSCSPPLAPLSASGEVSEEQLVWLRQLSTSKDFRGARLRLCLVHHHLLRMPFELGKSTPIEVGLRLRNAPEVMRACIEANIDVVFNGHRHHGYMVQLPGYPMVVSSPSSTLGCKSTDMRYVWLVDLSLRYPFPQAHFLNQTDNSHQAQTASAAKAS